MITRKESILLKPFQHRKFVEHRKKVSKALPRIDDVTPPERNHVYIKCKKLQLEYERHAQIERDNFTLLKHLTEIMSERRVDNFWLQEHPTFLRRIKLFGTNSKKVVIEEKASQSERPIKIYKNQRCVACNPEILPNSKPIPEERVPWEPRIKREFDYEKGGVQVIRTKNKFDQRDRSSAASGSYKSNLFSEQKLLLKRRSRSRPNINGKVDDRKHREQPLTVVMKFPQTVQVALNASIK